MRYTVVVDIIMSADTDQGTPGPDGFHKARAKYTPEELTAREADRKARAREWLLKEKAKVRLDCLFASMSGCRCGVHGNRTISG